MSENAKIPMQKEVSIVFKRLGFYPAKNESKKRAWDSLMKGLRLQ